VGRALPAKWQLAVAAAVAFLLYAIFAPIADWAGWRERQGSPGAERLPSAPTADQVRKVIGEKLAAMKRGEPTARDKERLAAESPGWEVEPYENRINEIYHLAKQLRGMDKSGQPPECVTQDECRSEARKAHEVSKRVTEQAEAEAAKAHGCDQRARAYAVVERLAVDVRFDPKTPAYSRGDSLWNRLSGLGQKEGACYRFEKYGAALKRQVTLLAEKLPPQPRPGAPAAEYDAWQAQRSARTDAERIALSVFEAYQRKGCWAAAVAGPEGKCVPAYDPGTLARARASGNRDAIVQAVVEALRLGAPIELMRKEIASIRP
jgi:hypothetical protein